MADEECRGPRADTRGRGRLPAFANGSGMGIRRTRRDGSESLRVREDQVSTGREETRRLRHSRRQLVQGDQPHRDPEAQPSWNSRHPRKCGGVGALAVSAQRRLPSARPGGRIRSSWRQLPNPSGRDSDQPSGRNIHRWTGTGYDGRRPPGSAWHWSPRCSRAWTRSRRCARPGSRCNGRIVRRNPLRHSLEGKRRIRLQRRESWPKPHPMKR